MPWSPDAGPAVLKKRLGEHLRALRTVAGITVAQTAAELDCGEAKVRHLENGRNVPSKSDLTVMVSLYRAAYTHQELEDLRKAATKRGWWSTYRLPSWLHNYVGLEADATVIRNFEVEVIPGLLQIEQYARDTHTLGTMTPTAADVDRLVEARLKRQELLSGEAPVTHHAIISEAALHRLIGTEYADAQYHHLLAMARKPNISFAVIPFSKKLYPGMAGSFILLDFPPNVSAPVAYYEHVAGGRVEHDDKVVGRLSVLFDELSALSMSPDETITFLEHWIEDHS